MNLSCEQITNMRGLYTKYEIKFLQDTSEMEFCDLIYHQRVLKKHGALFRRAYGSLSFEQRKGRKMIVEDLERDETVEPTHSD